MDYCNLSSTRALWKMNIAFPKRGGIDYKWSSPLGHFHNKWNFYTLCGRVKQNIAHPMYNFQIEVLNIYQSISGVTGRGQSAPPPRLLTGKFLLTYREKRGKEKWKREKMEKKRRKIAKGKVENWKWKEGKVTKWGEDLSFFFFFFYFPFSKWLKFVLGLPKWKFSAGKRHFTPGKKSRKMTLPLRKIFLFNTPLQSIWKSHSPCGTHMVNPPGDVSRSLKGGTGSLFDHCVTLWAWQPFWWSCMELGGQVIVPPDLAWFIMLRCLMITESALLKKCW